MCLLLVYTAATKLLYCNMRKLKIALLSLVLLGVNEVYAQKEEVCEAVTTILHDAPNKFRNIRGKQLETFSATLWECGIKVPGTINSRIVEAMGLYYEGALLQTGDVAQVRPLYGQYKKWLQECLVPQHYKMSLQENVYKGLEEYRKVVFLPNADEAGAPAAMSGHVALEVIFSKETGKYTLVLFVYHH